MEIEDIVEYVNKISPSRLLRYVSEKGDNSCQDCLRNHNLVFDENDVNIPQIPLHRNCRCHYEYVDNEGLKKIEENFKSTFRQVEKWAKKILIRGNGLLKDVDEILYKSTSNEIAFNAVERKISEKYVLLQYIIFAAEKIKLVEDILISESNKLRLKIDCLGDEMKSLATAIPDYINAVEKIHYPRLYDADQQIQNLPQSPREAIQRGFTKASPNENWYHRGKGQIENEKYYHKITGQEVVFDKNQKIVIDPENIGTRNYGPDPKSLDHILLDVIPYYIWGNSPEDTTPLLRRIFGYH